MSSDTLLSRQEFVRAVFARDKERCVVCSEPAVDAHHILDRKLYSDGGYYLSNGSSVCSDCHLRAEMTLIPVEELRERCGIVDPALPDGFRADVKYDKWGNPFGADGVRTPGPLIDDDGAKKILTRAGLLYSAAFRLYGG